MMLKKLFLMFTLFLMLPKVTHQQAWCHNRRYFSCLAQIMTELAECFQNVYDGIVDDNYAFVEFTPQYKMNWSIIDEGNQHKYTVIYDALTFIAGKINDPQVGDESVAEKVDRLFNYASISYTWGHHNDKDLVAYHNICHGLQVMMFSGMIYYSAHYDTEFEEADDDYDEDEMMAIMFAGLFHDSAHPGVGNGFFNVLPGGPDIHDDVSNAIKAYREKGVGVDAYDKQRLQTLAGAIVTLKDTNSTAGQFIFEKIHATIGQHMWKLITRNDDIEKADLVYSAILKTAYGQATPYWKAAHEELVAGKGSKQSVTKFINTMLAYRGKSDSSGFVHMADISANATSSRRFMMLTIKACLYEFHYEISVLKLNIGHGVLRGQVENIVPYKTIGGVEFENLMDSQKFFTGTIIKDDLLKNFISYADVFKDTEAALFGPYQEASEVDTDKHELTQAQADAIALYNGWKTHSKDFAEKMAEYLTGFPEPSIVTYFDENRTANLEWFNSGIVAEVADDDTVDPDFMYMTKNEHDEVRNLG